MPHGSKTPQETEARFRAEYLLSGNASAAARKVGIPVATGWDLAQRAHKDEAFLKARKALYASALEDVERMMLETVKTCCDRVDDANELEMQDPRPQYAAQVVAAYKALTLHRKIQAEADKQEKPTQVVVQVAAIDDDDSDDTAAPEPSTE